MNSLFRSARRTLAWGLLATTSLVFLVLARGINPELMLAFQVPVERTDGAEDESEESPHHQPPEHFAKADSHTRLDASQEGLPSSNGTGRARLNAQPADPDVSEDINSQEHTKNEHPSLPPFPAASEEEAAPKSPTPGAGPVFELPPPPEFTEAPASAAAEPAGRPSASTRVSEAANAVGTTTTEPQSQKPLADQDPKFMAQLTALREQLDRIAAAQEEQRASQQSWLESHYQEHQEQLDKKLAGIEAGLRELQEKSERLSVLAAKDQVQRITPRATITRGDRTVTSLSDGQYGASGVVRDVIESLADKSNVNLNLSINVAGDVAMSLQDPKSKGIESPQANGYIVGKDGRKVHVNAKPSPPENYLPPVVRNPDGTEPH